MAGRKTGAVSQAFRVAGSLAAAGIALKLVNVLWVAATGREVPDDPADPSVSTGEAIAFAATSAAVVGTAKLLVTRMLNTVRSGKPGDGAVDQEAVA